MNSSPITSRIFSTDSSSPVVTPAQLAAACDALLAELHSLLDPILLAVEQASAVKLKEYSNIAELRRATGLSRANITRLLSAYPSKVRTIASSPYSSFKRYHTQDFFKLISIISTPSAKASQPPRTGDSPNFQIVNRQS